MNGKYSKNDEVTVKDMILKIREYFMELKAAKKWILLSSFIFLILFGLKSFTDREYYKAELSFMINQDNGNPLGSLSGVLGTFGITAKSKNNLARVLELSRSRKIIENTLFNKVALYENEDFLANHLINYYDSLGKWNSRPWYNPFANIDDSLKDFSFRNVDVNRFEEKENKALKILYHKIAGYPEKQVEGILANSYDEESRIMYMSIELMNEDLAI